MVDKEFRHKYDCVGSP